MTLFSYRMGHKKVRDAIQIDSMDAALRNTLWNTLLVYFEQLDKPVTLDRGRKIDSGKSLLYGRIWFDFLKKPGDELLELKSEVGRIKALKGYFDAFAWYEVYDFVEFVAKTSSSFAAKREVDKYIAACNGVLERENSAYRFVNLELAPITSEHEIASIEEALTATAAPATLEGANANLKQALALLSNRTAPDYRNSIKESISAVEGVCKRIANMPNATLGQVLPVIQRPGRAIMPLHLQEGIRSIWGYTNGPDGIRHAMMEMTTIDIEDARFMLVTCAGLISYLIEKARKAGITL